MKLAGLFLGILVYAILITPGMATGDEKPKVEVDEAEIYLGDWRNFKKAGEVDLDAVFRKTPEYREILDRNIDEDNPRYLILMRAASDRFRTALDAVSDAEGYDLIGGLGAIKIEDKKVPNITMKVIAKLPK